MPWIAIISQLPPGTRKSLRYWGDPPIQGRLHALPLILLALLGISQ